MVSLTYWRGAGNEIGEGLAALAQQFIGTQNTLRQQDDARAQQAADNAFRQQQADEQRRQFDAQARQARDSQSFQWLSGQQQQLTQILAKGGYEKGSPEYQAAEHALKETNGLMRRVIGGEQLSPEDLSNYDTLMGNVGAVIGQGAANLGGRAAAQDNAALAATQAGTTATTDANIRANEMQPFSVANAGTQNRILGVQANVAEGTQQGQIDAGNAAGRLAVTQADEAAAGSPFRVRALAAGATTAESGARVAVGTEGAQIARPGLENEALGLQIDTGRWQLDDLKTKAPLVYEGLRLSNVGAQQALDFNADLHPEQLTALRQQNEQTRQAIDQSAELFPWQKDMLKADLDLKEAQVDIVQGTKQGTIDGTNSQNWQTIAQAGNPAKFDEYVKNGIMTPQQAAPYKRLAEAVARQRAAQVAGAEAQATSAQSQARVDVATEPTRIELPKVQLDLATLDRDFAKTTFADRVKTIALNKDTALQQLQSLRQEYAQNAQKFPKELAYLDSQIKALQTQTAGQVISNAAASFDLESAKKLFPVQLASAQTALASANEQLAAFREGRPVNLAILKANLATLNQALDQNGELFGPKLAEARAQVRVLESQARVMEGTEGAQVSTAGSNARAAAAGATTAEAGATVAVALIPSQIATGKIAPLQAQANLDNTLRDGKFADATFADRVRQVKIGTSTGIQQLLALKQQYSQNKAKFPKELEYLDAQIAVEQATAKEAAQKVLSPNGNGVTDKNTMIASLTQMRMINSQDVRGAQASLRATVQRLLPNARFSVDKYDSKSFSTMVANATNLTPDQRQELQNAQVTLDTAQATSQDLSVALGQVGAKGRIDPKVAERLGIYAPGEGDPSDPYGTRTYGGIQSITKFPATTPVPKTFTTQASFHISRVAGKLGIDPNALAAVISFETSGTFSPNARNPGSSATGLIQFMKDKKTGLYPGGLTRDQFGKLPFGQQMEHVAQYLKGRGIGPGSTIADIYAAVTGSGYKKGSDAYEKNKVWDADGNGVIEKGEQVMSPQFQAHVRDYFGGAQKVGPAAPTTPPTKTTAAPTPAPATTSAPTPTTSAPPAKLVPQTARPFVVQAKTPQDLERVLNALVAGGMPKDQAIQWIRNVKGNS